MSFVGKVMCWAKAPSDPESYDGGSNFHLFTTAPHTNSKPLGHSRFLNKADYQRFLVLSIDWTLTGMTMLKVLFATGEVGWIYSSLQGAVEFCQ